jgi:hypothetical protein
MTRAPAFDSVRARMLRAWALALVCAVAAGALAQHGFQALPRPRPLEELSYYPSGMHLKPAMLGHEESAADLAWLRAVQYYGEHRTTDNRFHRMSHVFDILTSMSPGFVPAYVFGAFALAQEGRDFQAAERLMLKGIEANPRNGELAFQLGFLHFMRPGGRDLPRAAEYFEQAARQADAPPAAARFAAFARQHAGSLTVAYELWSNVRERSSNHYVRETAEREMERIRRALAEGRVELATRKLTVPNVILGTR